MRSARRLLPVVSVLTLAVLLSGCSKEDTDGISTTHVTFPNGKTIVVEIERKTAELMKGMMFRDSLAEDHGMLFVNPKEDVYSYWLYQTRIPLDIIWMDHDRRVVEMSLDTPPCKSTSAKDCTNYGGNYKSKYVLEVSAGVAAKNGLKVGDTLNF